MKQYVTIDKRSKKARKTAENSKRDLLPVFNYIKQIMELYRKYM